MRKRIFLALTTLFVMTLSYAQEYMVFENNYGGIASLDVSIIKQAYFKTYDPYGSGTVIDPYNVAGANTKCKDIGLEFSAQQYYVKGLIKSITRNVNGSATFYISDDMSGINKLYANDIRVPLQNELNKGDEVVIYCYLRNTNNVSPEATGQLAAINGQTIKTSEPHGSGTLEDPYNVQAALDYISTLGADNPSMKDIYIKGYITSITEVYGSAYGNATYNISDTNEGLNRLLVYRGRYLGNTKYTDGYTNIKLGDEVIICGKVTNYKGTTPETVANQAYLYSLNGQTEAGLAIDGTWTGYIGTYIYDRFGLTGDNYRTAMYFVSENSNGGWGREVDYDMYSRYSDYYYCEFTWEIYGDQIRIRYADSWNDVYISNYTLTDYKFSGYMDDGISHDINFSLSYEDRFDWGYWTTRAPNRSSSLRTKVQACGKFSEAFNNTK